MQTYRCQSERVYCPLDLGFISLKPRATNLFVSTIVWFAFDLDFYKKQIYVTKEIFALTFFFVAEKRLQYILLV